MNSDRRNREEGSSKISNRSSKSKTENKKEK